LGVQLTDLTLVDGTPVALRSQFISRSGPTSTGRDAGAIAGTTALGAAIGAGADWGRGAAIGAGAGAVLGTLGVRDRFGVRVISGREGVEKPDLRIFELALERLALDPADASKDDAPDALPDERDFRPRSSPPSSSSDPLDEPPPDMTFRTASVAAPVAAAAAAAFNAVP
jgi:hypothetical protein